MNRNLHQAFAPVVLTLGLFSAGAVAQGSAPAPASPAAPAAEQGASSHAAPARPKAAAEHHAKKHKDRVEERITRLHTQLKITSEQAKQWEAFAQTMRGNARRIDQAIQDRAKKLPAMNADEVMKSYAALGQEHAEDLQKLSAAFSDLYGVLSDAQKQTADVLFRDQHAGKSAKHHSHHKSHKKSQHEAAPATPAAPAADVPAAK